MSKRAVHRQTGPAFCLSGDPPAYPHAFAPFAADMTGESRTVAVIFCQLCGDIREVEQSEIVNEDSPEWAERMVALRERAGE